MLQKKNLHGHFKGWVSLSHLYHHHWVWLWGSRLEKLDPERGVVPKRVAQSSNTLGSGFKQMNGHRIKCLASSWSSKIQISRTESAALPAGLLASVRASEW